MRMKEEYDPHKRYVDKYFLKELQTLLDKNNGSPFPIKVQFTCENYKTKWMSISEEDIEIMLDSLF